MNHPLLVSMALIGLGLGHVEAHEWYSGKISPTPGSGGPRGCCNTIDCRPLTEHETRFNRSVGQLEIFVNDRWWIADDPRWFVGPSPDGSWHACMMAADQEPRCTFGGAGS